MINMSASVKKFLLIVAVVVVYGLASAAWQGRNVLIPWVPAEAVTAYYRISGVEKKDLSKSVIDLRRDPIRIAHAGGIHEEVAYRNDLKALESNREYFSFFEIDFVRTGDGKLVCLHDWGQSFKRIWGVEGVVRFQEFRDLSGNDGCWPARLKEFLEANHGKYVVTDFKGDLGLHIPALKSIRDDISFHDRRNDDRHPVIPQIYNPSEFFELEGEGFPRIIWTLYRTPFSNEQILRHLEYLEIWAVTMPVERLNSDFVGKIRALGVKHVFTHPVDDCEIAREVLKIGVTGVYTKTIRSLGPLASSESDCEIVK